MDKCEYRDRCTNANSSWCLQCCNNPGAELDDWFEEKDEDEREDE